MKKIVPGLAAAALAGVVWWMTAGRSQPPSVPFAKAARETLVATLPTNGRAEPLEWRPVRADAAGVVETVAVQAGDAVAAGAVIARLKRTGQQAELEAAQARLAQARADLATAERGGRATEIAEIENALARARQDRETAEREAAALERLEARQAATRAEADAARTRVRAAELEAQNLERRRKALAAASELEPAKARVREAQAALDRVREQIAETVLRAPIAGVVYELAARPGAFLNPGDLVANVGRLDTLRVRIYVDEPELGRVEVGQTVVITWDGRPGREWKGAVERTPTSIQPLGSRQVGEVLCTIENPGRELAPGVNVNATIRTRVVESALVVPKEAIRRDAAGQGVFVLGPENKLEWKRVEVGASSITRTQIVSGVSEGDRVALPTDRVLQAGETVTPL